MADYLEHLAKVPLFAGADHRELRAISKATTEHTVEAGDVLVRQGELGREAFVIVEGTATVTVDDEAVASLGPGDTIGEMSLLDKGPRSATVTADTSMRLLVLDPREFKGLMMAVPSVAVKVAAALASRVRELDSRLYG